MEAPRREDPSDFEQEPFQSYLERWPDELSNVPEDVIEHWLYRHNDQVSDFCEVYDLGTWSFELSTFDNGHILEVLHFEDELEKLDATGDRLIMEGMPGYDTADYMLEYGTFPCPIIVAHMAGDHRHHKSVGDETMLEPYHLIEGHRRLGFIRAMIRNNHPKLLRAHEVWVVNIGGQPG
jgi:hypothetical protein